MNNITKWIIISMAIILCILIIYLVMHRASSTTSSTFNYTPTQTNSVSKTDSNLSSVKMYVLSDGTTNKKGNIIEGNKMSFNGNGMYIENVSSTIIKSINLTINNTYNNIGVWTYTIDSEGQADRQGEWSTYYQTTPLGTIFTDTYTIPCNVPPGGAFIVNGKQSSGEIIINGINFLNLF